LSHKKSAHVIKRALELDGRPETLRDFYRDWSTAYDSDVALENYSGPDIMAGLVADMLAGKGLKDFELDTDAWVMDAGCGTGLVGQRLHALGFKNLDGFDLSETMVEQAAKKGIYRELKAGVDINQLGQWYGCDGYDLVLCSGVFTSGHVAPDALNQLIWLTRSGGVIIVNTRTAYAAQSGFREEVEALEANNMASLEAVYENLPYTNDSKAHYWVLRITT